jgi:hypothetical protein
MLDCCRTGVFVGCFVSDVDGGSHGDPWPDTGSNWKDLNWEGCRQAARAAGYNTFVMEHPAGYAVPGHASCGHMETIAHGNYHDAGHNQYGRAPDTDCASEVDTEGHLLGGPWRFAVYAPVSTATCLQQSIGDEPVSNVHNVDECIPEGYVPAIQTDDLWMMVGCFVSDQDGNSHADPWADGTRWVDEDWYGCRQKAVDEGSAIFVMEYGQGYTQAGHASCGHMNVINHGNFHESTDSDAQHFLNTMGSSHAGDTGHNGFGRAPLEDCTGEIDDAGHALGGPWRFAVYAQHEIATCLNDFNPGETQPHGCWIGLADRSNTPGAAADDTARFRWSDSSPLNYGHWAPGEPNGGQSSENFVEMDMRGGIDGVMSSDILNRQGGWNDQHAGGDGNLGKYPLCETRAPNKANVAGIHTLNGATNTQQYVGVGQRMSWANARAYCQSQYHDLAAIHDEASNRYIRQLCAQQVRAGRISSLPS